MASDPVTGQVLLFGGVGTNDVLADTWLWNGTTWTQRTPSAHPSARAPNGMATDTATGRVVLFGGIGIRPVMADTWLWEGTNWTHVKPATKPTARNRAALATDPTTGHVMLFGGFGADGNVLNDTWTWDGTTWTRRTPATSPPARDLAAMAADPVHHRVVLFGGFGATGNALGDTWTWDGTTWTHQSPVTRPPARFAASLATDTRAAESAVVLFGGFNFATGNFNDTWTWDGATWARVTPAIGPPSRHYASTATDPSGRVVLFGGEAPHDPANNVILLNDTWSLTPSLSITPRRGPPGAAVTVRGFGYTPGTTIMVVKYGRNGPSPYRTLCSAIIASDTRFTCTGHIPPGSGAGAPGRHDIVAKDSAGLKSATTFTLTT
jgi:hypothetical protein